MSDNKQASNAILKGIKHLIDKEIENLPIDKTFTGLIKEVKEDNLYNVLIQGKIYTNIPSIFDGLNINETVKIKVPQNQYSQMYIEGKYNVINLNQINKISELENKNNELVNEIELLKQEIEQLKGGTN